MGKKLEYIVKGAMAQCNQSKVPMIAQLNLISDNMFVNINGNLVATTLTLGPVFGPAPFGVCNMIPPTPAVPTPPCVCAILSWSGAYTSIKSNMVSSPLTTDSKGTCALGGSISFKMSGQFPKPSIPPIPTPATGSMNMLSISQSRQNSEAGYKSMIGEQCIQADDAALQYVAGQKGKPNSTIDIGGVEHRTDEKGKVILNPNTTYVCGDSKYQTDEQGRVVMAVAKVNVTKAKRPTLQNKDVKDRITNNVDENGKADNDDRGHVIAHVLGGSSDEINLLAQNFHLNRSEYRSLENEAQKAKEEDENKGKEVYMIVEIIYPDNDTKRPESYIASVEVQGEKKPRACKNFLNRKKDNTVDLLNQS